MSQRSITIKETPVHQVERPDSGRACVSDANTLEVEVRYEMGGICYGTYRNNPRGFYLSATPVKVEQSDGVGFRSFGAFSGTKILIEAASRFSAKKLQEIANHVEHLPVFQELVDSVLDKNGLEIVAEEPATA